ncbi:MAG: DUF1616 domain-containing protein [Candidatus Woesearchaeota archaeon]|nr:DUF1616 domain-containing protein [Nanoarchaeota archaeon]USN44141.1 MAG: DUF1616 domain-containing protein [Candidatus Woesearchaeota archaeon]
MAAIKYSKKDRQILGFALPISAIVFLSLVSMTPMTFAEAARAAFGGFFVLFFPGFFISMLFFKDCDILEKIALSFALSIALVPLVVFYLNFLFGLRITMLSISLSIALIIIFSLIISIYEKKISTTFSQLDSWIEKNIFRKKQ